MFEKEIQILKALANGINYFTGEKCKDDCILNDVNIIRTLYEVCDGLRKVPSETIKKSKFIYPFDIEEKFEYEEELSLTRIIDKISNMYPTMKKPKFSLIREILIQQGLLEKVTDEDGSKKTLATEQALQFGIYNVEKLNIYGKYYQVITYNKEGQKYILSLLKNINIYNN